MIRLYERAKYQIQTTFVKSYLTTFLSHFQVQAPSVVNHNGMIVYQAGLYGSDLVYYPITQTNMTPGAGLVRNGGLRLDKGRNGVLSRPANNRNNYLGYSAGKATFGRYYAKNNLDRSLDMYGTNAELPCETLCNIADAGMPATIIKGNPSVPAIPSASSVPVPQGIPQYVAPIAQNGGQLIPTLVSQHKNSEAVLEDLCQTNMWGAPSYQLFTTSGPDNRQLFLYKIVVPAFQTVFQVRL